MQGSEFQAESAMGDRNQVTVDPGLAQRSSIEPARAWFLAFQKSRNISHQDSWPLYRFRMSDGEYQSARTLLNQLHASGRLISPDNYAGAIFVAYCAEWFRRDSTSTFLRWNDPAPALLSQIPDEQKRDLTELGLRLWGRPLRIINDRRRFLLTIALEGGFPVRLLREGARGWLKDYLRTIMRRAISLRATTQEEIVSIAQEERGRMRGSYQHDDFIALCSELVSSLIQLRAEAESNQHLVIRNSSLLDVIHPGWREMLPIYVPPADEALVDELLTGLLNERMTGLITDGVEVHRYLIKSNELSTPE